MGKFDSTKTRVIPLFEFVGSDFEKLNILFSLFDRPHSPFSENCIDELRYGKDEKKIPASNVILKWMINNPKRLIPNTNYGCNNTMSASFQKRKLFFSGNTEVKAEALRLLSVKSEEHKGWYVFEGKTSPDIFIKTKDSIYVGEAKRTEKNITTKTRWLKSRDQLIRHIDSLLDQENQIYSFYILEKKNFGPAYQEIMKKYYDKNYFRENLEHRNEEQISRAFESFLGFIFWEDVSKRIGIKFLE